MLTAHSYLNSFGGLIPQIEFPLILRRLLVYSYTNASVERAAAVVSGSWRLTRLPGDDGQGVHPTFRRGKTRKKKKNSSQGISVLTTFTQICLGTLYVGIAETGWGLPVQLTVHVSIGDPDCCSLVACKGEKLFCHAMIGDGHRTSHLIPTCLRIIYPSLVGAIVSIPGVSPKGKT